MTSPATMTDLYCPPRGAATVVITDFVHDENGQARRGKFHNGARLFSREVIRTDRRYI